VWISTFEYGSARAFAYASVHFSTRREVTVGDKVLSLCDPGLEQDLAKSFQVLVRAGRSNF
jgi:hypothetical protein